MRRSAIPFAALLFATLIFRLPPLLNAAGVGSDAAIVGLQARHMLRGELSPFLWGAGYQGSLEAALLAVAFAVAGASPLVLMLVPLCGHLLLTWFVFDVLRMKLPPASAALAALPVVLTPQAISGVALYAPRQWCITLVFAGLWLIDGASSAKRPWLRIMSGVTVAVLSLYLDLYALLFLPGLGLFTALCCLDPTAAGQRVVRTTAAATGAALGAFGVWLPRQLGSGSPTETALSVHNIARNFHLLWEQCLPWVLGYGVFIPGKNLYPDLWEPPAPVRWFQILGAVSLVVAIGLGALWLFWRKLEWPLRRLAPVAFVVSASSIGGFLFSGMPSNMWSARYLAPIVWTAPFALAPLAALLSTRRLALAVAPYLTVAALGGWLSYGLYVRGPLPVLDPRGVAADEQQVADFLRARGVHHAAAQYWLSYRLSFLYGEDPLVIPISPSEDRYPPYREQFDRARRVAYVFHPSEPRARIEEHEPWVRAQGWQVERAEVAGFSMLLVERPR